MANLQVRLEQISVGCNAISNAICSNAATSNCRSEQIDSKEKVCGAFAAKNGVAIIAQNVNASTGKTDLRIQQLLHHRAPCRESTQITSVYLNESLEVSNNRILAGDSEGRIFLWSCDSISQSFQTKWNISECPLTDNVQPPLEQVSVSAIAAIQTRKRWIYTAAFTDGRLIIWQQLHKNNDIGTQEQITVIDQRLLGSRSIIESLDMQIWQNCSLLDIDEENVVIAGGSIDCNLHIFELRAGEMAIIDTCHLEGHRDWIRSISFNPYVAEDEYGKNILLQLASASQDQKIRIWDLNFNMESKNMSGKLTGVLTGHEDWVTCVKWEQPELLLTCSMDSSLIGWKLKKGETSRWDPEIRFGQIEGNGILASLLLPSIEQLLDIVLLTFNGQFERWRQVPSNSTEEEQPTNLNDMMLFSPARIFTGHTKSVTDLSWSARGEVMVSVSLDQTARIFGVCPVYNHDVHTVGLYSSREEQWVEISRAQVHGYDLQCVSFFDNCTKSTELHNFRYVSGADEKILRVFEAPDTIQSIIRSLELSPSGPLILAGIQPAISPELSLTNKVINEESINGTHDVLSIKTVTKEGCASSKKINLPVGDTLSKHTLWPERRKLYGHGNELLCVAASPSGSILASACKSREAKFASIWIWNTTDFSVVSNGLPSGHSSSVVQLEFSPDEKMLLSVSKDRHFCLYSKAETNTKWSLLQKQRAHKRIIWSCSWTHDSNIFALGSRDQSFSLWGKKVKASQNEPIQFCILGDIVTLSDAVTAVAFAPVSCKMKENERESRDSLKYLLAVGLESGGLNFFHIHISRDSGELVTCSDVTSSMGLSSDLYPSATITRLAWAPVSGSSAKTRMTLAASSSDHSIYFYSVTPP